MSRRSNQKFICKPLDELARQLVRAPEQRKAEQVRRAEKLHDQIEPDATYPYDYIAYRVTGFRPSERVDTLLLIGEAVAPDLRLLIDNLSRSIQMQPGPEERLRPAREVARQLGVSAKTIGRWRKAGLRWRWSYDPSRGQSVVCISDEAVARFRLQRPSRVREAAAFTRITEEGRGGIIQAARAMAQADPGLSLNRVAKSVAQQISRAHETVRQVLEKHDADHPEAAIFPGHTRLLSDRDRRMIYQAIQKGVATKELAAQFGRSPAAIRRAASYHRLTTLLRLDLSGPEPQVFHRAESEQIYLSSERARAADQPGKRFPTVPVDGLPPTLLPLYRQPMLDSADQRHLFRRYHYLRYRARAQLAATPRRAPRVRDLNKAQAWIDQSYALRDRLVRANLATVLSVARRHMPRDEAAPPRLLIALLEVGHMGLIDAAEAFDPFRSRDFEGYLTNRLLRRLASSPANQPPRRRARRRDEDLRVLNRLLHQARQRGVELLGQDKRKPGA